MSRSGYSDSLDQWELIKWRGQVASAIRGKRGQAFLRDLAAALDAMPNKRLIRYEMRDPNGEVCTLGCVAAVRGLNLAVDDPEDTRHHDEFAAALDIARPLVAEIEFKNDEAAYYNETPEHRWTRMRAWVESQIGRAASPDPREGT